MPHPANWLTMAILNPDHLLEQAERLVQPPPAGPPRQVDLRRAISAAYYALFHEIVTNAGDQVVGFIHRSSREHGLVCRAIDHGTIKKSCIDLGKTTPPAKYAPYLPTGGFGPGLTSVIAVFPDLMDARHNADYNTLARFLTSDAKGHILTSRAAITALRNAPADHRKAFLFLLLFPPRG